MVGKLKLKIDHFSQVLIVAAVLRSVFYSGVKKAVYSTFQSCCKVIRGVVLVILLYKIKQGVLTPRLATFWYMLAQKLADFHRNSSLLAKF